MTRVVALVFGLALLAGCADGAEDVEPFVMLDGFVFCTVCELAIGPSDTLEAESEQGLVPGRPRDLDVASDGRMAAVFSSAGEPMWFDRAGRIIGVVGPFGDGPGEYRSPHVLVPTPDSLIVFEYLGRVTAVDVRSEDVRTGPVLPFVIEDAIVLSWPDRVVVSYGLGPPVGTVHSLAVFDLSGRNAELIAEFEPWSQRTDARVLHRRHIAKSSGDTFWAVDYADYRITRRDVSGRILAEARRNAEWAPDGSADSRYGPSIPPPPRMQAVHQDQNSRVWVMTRAARADWETAWTSRGITEVHREMPADSLPRPDELFQSRIEVFSANLDTLLVSEALPLLADRFVSDGRLLRYSLTEVGFPIIELMDVRLADRDRPGSS